METKKEKIVSAVATMGIVLTLFGATYAYFASRVDAGKITDVEITANTVDVFSFETGDSISISLDQESFAEGTGDKSSSTFAKATLTPNNKTNTATGYYYVYLNISDNTFSYSLGSDKPEILLQVMDADGATVTSLNGLTYSTVTNGSGEPVSGFDITTKTGLITLANNREITANTTTKEDTWNINVIYVNYNENQSDNAGNGFKAKLMIQEEEMKPTLAEWVVAQYTGTQGENNLYYHDSTLANGANDNSYRYAGSSATTNNYVCFGSDADTCPNDNLYRIIGVFDGRVRLIKADYVTSALLGTDTSDYYGTYSEITSYYQGDSSNLTNIAAYYWNNVNHDASFSATGYYNDWSYSELNKTHLNKNFLENIGTSWANMIDSTVWKVGGIASTDVVPSTVYTNEITSPSTQVASTYESKVGLMYVSDYYYGAGPTYWTYPGQDSNGSWNNDYTVWTGNDYSTATEENWMYMGIMEWTMARSSAVSDIASYAGVASYINNTGLVLFNHVRYAANAVRPVFHLKTTINYVSGSGTKTDSIRVN